MRRGLASLIANPEFQFCRRLEDVQCVSCHFCLSFSLYLSFYTSRDSLCRCCSQCGNTNMYLGFVFVLRLFLLFETFQELFGIASIDKILDQHDGIGQKSQTKIQ